MQFVNLDTSITNLKLNLEKDGVAVIPNIINQNEIENMRSDMWDMLSFLTKNMDKPILKNDASTWNTYFNLQLRRNMILQDYGVGHAQYVWNLRQHPNIVNIFSYLWDCKPENLLTSFDGMSIHFPPEVTGKFSTSDINSLHTDQSFLRNNLECYQSFVSLFDIEKNDASLTFLKGSHIFHKEASELFVDKNNPESLRDYFKITPQMYDFYTKKGCQRCNIICKAGSMVIWDSRTIHAGIESLPNRNNPKMRNVVYICQLPRNNLSNDFLLEKQNFFNDGKMTSHWANKNIPNFDTDIKNKNLVPSLPKPILSPLGLRLAGFD